MSVDEVENIPKLSEVDPEVKISAAQKAVESLRVFKEEDLELDYNYSGSDISDPFEENTRPFNTLHKLRKARKKLSKLEDSLKIMNAFTEDFKRNMEEIRAEMESGARISYENMDDVDEILKKAIKAPHISEKLKLELEAIFKDEEYLTVGPDLDIPDRVVEETEEKTLEQEYDYMSGFWRMLETSKDCVVSHPFYHADRQNEPHWLDREGVSWKVLDAARSKCENWIEENVDKF